MLHSYVEKVFKNKMSLFNTNTNSLLYKLIVLVLRLLILTFISFIVF